MGIKTYLSKTLEASAVVDGGVMDKDCCTEEKRKHGEHPGRWLGAGNNPNYMHGWTGLVGWFQYPEAFFFPACMPSTVLAFDENARVPDYVNVVAGG